MSISNINKNILSTKILDSINTNLGVDNSYTSSKTKLIADSFSEEISTISSSTVNVMNRYSASTAEGFYLDIVAAEEGVYRNNVPYVTTDQNVSYVLPISSESGFDDLLIGKEIIKAGEQVTIDNNYIVTFLKPVDIGAKFENVECSVRIEAYDLDSNIYINKNTLFTLTGNNNPYLDFVKLKIAVDINSTTSTTDDDSFRVSIYKAKALKNRSTIEAIGSEMTFVHDMNGYSILAENGNIDIFIVTNSMIQNSGTDSKIDKYKSHIKARMQKIVSAGLDVNVKTPDLYILEMTYTDEGSSIPSQLIKDVIVEFIQNNYTYAESQTFDVENITRRIHFEYPSLNKIRITSIGLFDPALNKNIVSQQSILNVDRYGYVVANPNNITEE